MVHLLLFLALSNIIYLILQAILVFFCPGLLTGSLYRSSQFSTVRKFQNLEYCLHAQVINLSKSNESQDWVKN